MERNFKAKKNYKTKTDGQKSQREKSIQWLHNRLKLHYVKNTTHTKISMQIGYDTCKKCKKIVNMEINFLNKNTDVSLLKI